MAKASGLWSKTIWNEPRLHARAVQNRQVFSNRPRRIETALGDHTYEDSKGKQYADDFLVFLVSSIPFVGLQLAGVVDKAGKAVGFTKADDSWSALNGIGYFLAGWTGIAKPYEFSPELNFEQYMRARKLMVDEFTQKERKKRAAFEAKAKGL